MMTVLGLEIAGREVPQVGGVSALVVGGIVLIFLMSRAGALGGSGSGKGQVGEGQRYHCQRCGNHYFAQTAEAMPGGKVRRQFNDKCPNCGWDKDWGDSDRSGHKQTPW